MSTPKNNAIATSNPSIFNLFTLRGEAESLEMFFNAGVVNFNSLSFGYNEKKKNVWVKGGNFKTTVSVAMLRQMTTVDIFNLFSRLILAEEQEAKGW